MRRLWVGRTLDGNYDIGTKRKEWNPVLGFGAYSLIHLFDEDFRYAFNFCLVRGSVRRIYNIHMDIAP